jgi:hypothetical protein
MAVTELRAVKVGVLLDRDPEDLGEWLADARAFEAAGAAALWVDPASGRDLDPFALLAALAALTSEALLVTDLPAGAPGATVATVALLSRGRLALVAEPDRLEELAGGCGAFRRLPGTPPSFELVRPPAAATPPYPAAAEAPSPPAGADAPGRPAEAEAPGGAAEATGHPAAGEAAERWVRVAAPEGRAAWRATVDEAAAGGAAGLLVPAGPRLLDILRHPEDPGGRQDLHLAQG